MNPDVSLTVIILTYNEEIHIERAIASVSSFAESVIVVDSYSSDRTAEIAKASGATILQNKFLNYAKQFQWALENAPIETDWVMRLDADEVVEADLRQEIIERLPSLGGEIVGVNLKRKHIFMGRWIRHGGRYPLILLRLWRRGQGRIEQRWMDEHIIVWGGRTVTFEGGFADENMNDLTFFTDKHNKYATREAIDALNHKYRLFAEDVALSDSPGSEQAGLKRTIKNRVYNKMPMFLGPLFYFLYRYIIQMGFLDGRPGLVYHFLQAGWYRFLVEAKISELESQLSGCSDTNSRRARLAALTGHTLD